MLFCDYYFSVIGNGSMIEFDDELSSKDLGVKPGDTFIVTESLTGKLILKKFDITTYENIVLEQET
jgi:hypothetical protein